MPLSVQELIPAQLQALETKSQQLIDHVQTNNSQPTPVAVLTEVQQRDTERVYRVVVVAQ